MKYFNILRNRGLALFMALVMCLSLLPPPAMAAEGDGTVTIHLYTNLADGKYFPDDFTITLNDPPTPEYVGACNFSWPSTHELLGWATESGGEVKYDPKISTAEVIEREGLEAGDEIELYAVWKMISIECDVAYYYEGWRDEDDLVRPVATVGLDPNPCVGTVIKLDDLYYLDDPRDHYPAEFIYPYPSEYSYPSENGLYDSNTYTAGELPKHRKNDFALDYVYVDIGWRGRDLPLRIDEKDEELEREIWAVMYPLEIHVHFAEDKLGYVEDSTDPNCYPGDGIPDKYQKLVTLRVENGTWSDGTDGDQSKFVALLDRGSGKWSEGGEYNLTLPSDMQPDENYGGGGWYSDQAPKLKPDDTTVVITAGMSNAVLDPIVFTYIYERLNTLTLRYDANGGSGTMEPQDAKGKDGFSASFEVKANAFTYPGYTFTGWNTEPDGTGMSYGEAERITLDADAVLYAQWTETVEEPGKTITVTWVNGVTGETIDKREIPEGGSLPANPAVPVNDGWIFVEWVQTENEDGSITIIANYRRPNITWVNGYDGGVIAAGTVNPDGTYPANPAAPVRPGYAFAGWSAPVADAAGDLTISATWTPVAAPTVPTVPAGPIGGGTTTIPGGATPLAPTGTTINDGDVPLAAPGLNSTDHFDYIKGYSDGTVRPEASITRAEVATIFFRLMTNDFRTANWATENDFSDVQSGDWYNNAVSTCAKAGILKGYSDGTFKPNDPITRAEFASIAASFASEEVPSGGMFSDIEGHWAQKSIERAAAAGWIKGSDGKFRPNDQITRAEVIVTVNRMLDRVPDAAYLLADMKTFSDNTPDKWYYADVQEATNSHDYERAEDGVTGIWTELLPEQDWTALEKEWATAADANVVDVAEGLRSEEESSEDDAADDGE